MKDSPPLLQLRIAARLSLREAARLCGVSRQSIRLWELGVTLPDTLHAARYAEVLGITQAHLNELLSQQRTRRASEKMAQ